MRTSMRFIISLLLVGFWPLANSFAQVVNSTAEIGFSDFFFQKNQTSASDVIILGMGNLSPKGCERWDGYSVTHESPFVHLIGARAQIKEFCVGQITPFAKQINMGKLEPGVHVIKYLDVYLKPAEKIFEVKAP